MKKRANIEDIRKAQGLQCLSIESDRTAAANGRSPERVAVDLFVRSIFEMGPNVGIDRVPDEVVWTAARNAGVTESMALLEFIDAASRLHVDRWSAGLDLQQYAIQHRVRAGRVNMWAAVLRCFQGSAGGAA